jgi:hypothetical protein
MGQSPSCGLDVIFLRVRPADIAYIKFLFESYEGVGLVRTLDRRAAIIMALVSHDFLPAARGIIESARQVIACEEVPAPPEAEADWLIKTMMNDQ